MIFDFRFIAEKYPKAFALLEKWIWRYFKTDGQLELNEINGRLYFIGVDELMDSLNPLELDLFFDEKQIIGNIDNAHEKHWTIKIESALGLEVSAGYGDKNESLYQSREEALSAKWLKEFAILERQQS